MWASQRDWTGRLTRGWDGKALETSERKAVISMEKGTQLGPNQACGDPLTLEGAVLLAP